MMMMESGLMVLQSELCIVKRRITKKREIEPYLYNSNLFDLTDHPETRRDAQAAPVLYLSAVSIKSCPTGLGIEHKLNSTWC